MKAATDAPIIPAALAFTADGTPYSPSYDDVYHPAQGALAQASHVFLGGNGLPDRWRGRDCFTILETGFGIGFNFLATWRAWRDAGRPCRLHFVSVELHPFQRDDLRQLLTRHPELTREATALLAAWPLLTPGLHRLHFDDDRLTLTVALGDAPRLLPRIVARADAIYLDGFAPDRNPALWSQSLLVAVDRLCAPDATLATWSVAGALRRGLEALGWIVERRSGFGAKRQMLSARRRPAVGAVPPSLTFSGPRHAMVIGAGLAGAAIAERLAARGWRIDLIEQHAAPAREASGNPAGAVFPRLTRDDSLAGRLSRAAYLYALHRMRSLARLDWQACGVLQLARDAPHERHQRETVSRLALPRAFATFVERDAVAARLDANAEHGGWWFPGGGWVSPISLCEHLLGAAGKLLTRHFERRVARLDRAGDEWWALDHAGARIARAPHVILANAVDANALLAHGLPLIPVRGQITYLPSHPRPALDCVVCRNGYLTPAASGTICLGASFDRKDLNLALRPAEHAENLARLDELLPGGAQRFEAEQLRGRAGLRTTTPDRLPLAGTLADAAAAGPRSPTLATLPRLPGLHVLLGLGSRGIVWAPLAAELLAARLEGEPLPVERNLAEAIDPARFHLRALRRGLPQTHEFVVDTTIDTNL